MPVVERVLLVDNWTPLVHAWAETFAEINGVEVHESDFFAHDAHAMVSPANSFGIMDGGLDAAIRSKLGGTLQNDVQRMIVDDHHGEMPVGTAAVVQTGHKRWPFLVVAPTMRVPESIANTLNAYLAFRAALLAVNVHNASSQKRPIKSIVVPGLGTGIGALDARRCAAQMRVAYDHVLKPARIPSFRLIHETHRKLRSAL